MSSPFASRPSWLIQWMQERGIVLWGAANLGDGCTPPDDQGRGFPFAVSWAVPMNPRIMARIRNGPNRDYADEYARVNARINETSRELATELARRGSRSKPLEASARTDPVRIRGDFPHKTAATRAGLGWIGRHCQLVTRRFGSWVRLGTVFTDLALPCGPPMERHFCGSCARCVEACPAGALTGAAWYPGMPREEILDVYACDGWKKEHWYRFHKGHVCGICSSVCPYGLKFLGRTR